MICLYLLANVAYLVTLPFEAVQHAPADRVATATLNVIFPAPARRSWRVAIMISTFGCNNGLILAGARAYYAMARDGLFFRSAGQLNDAKVPAWGLVLQGVWAAALVLPRTYDVATGAYGNLYSNLLDYVISAALIFYILTIAGVFRLRSTRPDAERPYRAFGYPIVPALYIVGAATILVVLFIYKTSTTWPGLVIVLLGVPVYFLLAEALSGLAARAFSLVPASAPRMDFESAARDLDIDRMDLARLPGRPVSEHVVAARVAQDPIDRRSRRRTSSRTLRRR